MIALAAITPLGAIGLGLLTLICIAAVGAWVLAVLGRGD